MIEVEEIREKLGETGPMLGTPEGAITYSITQLVNFLREQKFDIPVKATAEQLLTIVRDIAKDPVLHVKLLDKKWVRDLFRTFVAKSPDQEKIFNRVFEDVMHVSGKKSTVQVNDVMAFASNVISQKIHGFNSEYEFENPQKKSAKFFLTNLNAVLSKAGFDPSNDPEIIDRAGKAEEAAILESLETSFKDAIISQINDVLRTPLTGTEQQTMIATTGEMPTRGFMSNDLTEEFVIRALEKAYINIKSQNFDAAVTKFLYDQKARGIAARAAKTGSSAAESNMLFGAFNEYLTKIHGKSVPNVYSFPFNEGIEINEEVSNDAAKDALRLTVGELTWARVKKEILPMAYGNMISRTMYIRALMGHVMSNLQNTGKMALTIDELISIAGMWEQQEIITEESLAGGEESMKKTGSSSLYANAALDKSGLQSAAYRGKTDAEKRYINAAMIILAALRDQKLTWEFKSGPNAGKTIKVTTIKDLLQYARERREAQQQASQKINTEIVQGSESIVAGRGPFLTRKDIRDLKELLSKIPDPSVPKKMDKLVGNGKFGKDLRDKIKNEAAAARNPAARNAMENVVDKVTFTPKQIKALRDKISKIGAPGAVKKLDSAAKKGSIFTRPEIDEISNAMSGASEKSASQFWESFKGAKVPRDKINEIKSAVSQMDDDDARRKIMSMLGPGNITAKDVVNAMQATDGIQDPSLRQSIQDAIATMKMNPEDEKKIKEKAKKAGEQALEGVLKDAESRGGATADDVQSMLQAAGDVKDEKMKKALSAAIGKSEFSGDKESLGDLVAKIPDKKVRDKIDEIVGKKITPGDIAAISKAVRNADGNEARDEANKSLDGTTIEPENMDEVESAAENIDQEAAREEVKEIIGNKGANIPGNVMDEIVQEITEKPDNQSVIDEIQDEIDQQIFSPENVERARKAAKQFKQDPAMQRVDEMLEGADGKQLNPSEERDINDLISQIPDEDTKIKASNILKSAKKDRGKQRQGDRVAGEIGDEIEGMEDALNDSAAGMDRGTWKLGNDVVKFLKRQRNAIKNGADPSGMFGDMGDGTDLKMAFTRMAKQGNIDNMMMKWFDSMFKMFNTFADNASTDTQKALFGSIANNMNINSKKIKSHVTKVDLDPDLKRQTEEINAHNRKVKEDADKLMATAAQWYTENGMDVTDVMIQKIKEKIKQSQEGSRLIPVPGSIRIVFDKKPGRVLCADFSVKPKRRLMFPSTEELRVPSAIGGKSPTAFPDEIVSNAVDEYVATTEQTGNVDPGSGGGGPGGTPPKMRLEDFLKRMKKAGVNDVARDIGRGMVDQLMRAVSPQNMQKSTGNDDVEIEDPKDQLDLEAGIDFPSFGNETSTGSGLNIQQAGMPFKPKGGAGGAGKPSPGGATSGGRPSPGMQRGGGGMPQMPPAPAKGSAQSMCQKGSCGSRATGNRPGGPKEVQVGLDGKPIKKGEKIYDDDTVVDHRRAGTGEGDPGSWYPEGTSPEEIARRERERVDWLKKEEEERQRKIDKEQEIIDKLNGGLKDPEKEIVEEGYGTADDPIKDIQQKVAEMQDNVKSGVDDIESEIYKPLGIMNPKDFLKPGSIITAAEIEEMLKVNAQKPENAAYMRKLFQLAMRNDYSTIMRQRSGRRKLSTIDLNATMRRNLRHGKNPSNDRLNVTTLYHRYAKNVKRDIFVADISGSMSSFLAMTGQLIASLADPKALSVVLFDTDAVEIDKSVFMNNPGSIFQTYSATRKFAEATVEKTKEKRKNQLLSEKWDGMGTTSYDKAAGILSKMNINKGDRIIIIGDLEHNTPHYTTELADLKSSGACNSDFECIAAWYANICKKADSCIVINPKDTVGNDMTCEMLDYGIPTCLVGAMNANKDLNGDGLMRTVQCLKMGMTGQKPRMNESVLRQCKTQERKDKVSNRMPIGIDFGTFTM